MLRSEEMGLFSLELKEKNLFNTLLSLGKLEKI